MSTSSPPLWSARFSTYFQDLKSWIERSAYPALINGPLKAEEIVTSLPRELSKIETELAQRKPIPVAVVGRTGVGKSTALNALLEQDILPTGVVGSQTAALVEIRYAPEWEVTFEYIGENELQQIFEDARTPADDAKETGSPEIRESAEKKIRALFSLKADDAIPLEVLQSPSEELLKIVRHGKRRFSTNEAWKDELDLHARKRYWPITKSIDVRGPFPMLESGIVISDLPGAGDLNQARVSQATRAIRDAGQILIAIDGRGFQRDLMEQLETAGRLPHRLFRDGESFQIVVIGTSLDKGVPEPEEDAAQVVELGLDPEQATTKDVFSAICERWREMVGPQLRAWLREKASEFLPDVAEEDRARRVDMIMENVEVIPTSAGDWRRSLRRKDMKYCKSADETGFPKLQRVINNLAEHQIRTTEGYIEGRINNLRDVTLAAVERSEAALGADIQAILDAVQQSGDAMKEVQNKHAQIIDDLRLAVLDRFQQIRELLHSRIEIAALKMAERGQHQVRTHLEGVHWGSLKATVLRNGIWHTGSGRQINLRDAMGGEVTRLVPQAWSQIVEQRLTVEIDKATEQIFSTLSSFSEGLLGIISGEVGRESDKQTVERLFTSGRERAELKIIRRADKIRELLGKTSREMQEKIDEAVQNSLQNVCETCGDDSGFGWKNRSMERIVSATSEVARSAESRCQAIAEDAIGRLEAALKAFCADTVGEMEKLGDDIPRVLRDAVETRLHSPQEQRSRLEAARLSAPATFVA